MGKSKGCDVCGLKKSKLTVMQCTKCQLNVHQECYLAAQVPEMIGEGKFVCIACQAVGRTFEAVDKHMSHKYYHIKQETRPTECELCNISDGIHAMHPLYDYHGSSARQICCKNKDNKTMRLAWGHTLCCFFFASYGLLYGCTKDGAYEGEDDDFDDKRPPNPSNIIREEYSDMYGEETVCQFRYYLPDPSQKKVVDMDVYRKAAWQYRHELKCAICGMDDQNKKTLRIPLQCVAGNTNEYEEFKGKHKSLSSDEACTVGVHVGCAKWGGENRNQVRRVYYYPGDEDRDTTYCLYCTLHAEEVDYNYQKKKRKDEKEAAELEKKEAPKRKEKEVSPVMKPRGVVGTFAPKKNAAVRKNSIDLVKTPAISTTAATTHKETIPKKAKASKEPPSKRKSSEVDISSILAIPKKKKQRTPSLTGSVSGSVGWTGAPVSKKDNVSTNTSTHATSFDAAAGPTMATTSIGKKQKKSRFLWGKQKAKDRYAELDPTQAVAVNAGERPTLAKKRRELADKMSIVSDAKSEQIFEDLLDHLDDRGSNTSPADVYNVRQKYWKREFGELTKQDFDIVWNEAKKMINKYQEDGELDNDLRRTRKRKRQRKDVQDDVVARNTDEGKKPESAVETSIADFADDTANESKESESIVPKPKVRPPDRWSKYFVGPAFQLSNQFTLDDF